MNIKNLQKVILASQSEKYIPLDSNTILKALLPAIKLRTVDKYRVTWAGLCLLSSEHKYCLKWSEADKNNSYLRIVLYSVKRHTIEYTADIPKLFWHSTFSTDEKNLIPDKNYKTIDDYFGSNYTDITYYKLSKYWIMLRDCLLSG